MTDELNMNMFPFIIIERIILKKFKPEVPSFWYCAGYFDEYPIIIKDQFAIQ